MPQILLIPWIPSNVLKISRKTPLTSDLASEVRGVDLYEYNELVNAGSSVLKPDKFEEIRSFSS